jgi:hypothetical protein
LARDNRDGNNANGLARVTVNKSETNLAAFADCVVLGLRRAARAKCADGAVSVGCHNVVRDGLCKLCGNKLVHGEFLSFPVVWGALARRLEAQRVKAIFDECVKVAVVSVVNACHVGGIIGVFNRNAGKRDNAIDDVFAGHLVSPLSAAFR